MTPPTRPGNPPVAARETHEHAQGIIMEKTTLTPAQADDIIDERAHTDATTTARAASAIVNEHTPHT